MSTPISEALQKFAGTLRRDEKSLSWLNFLGLLLVHLAVSISRVKIIYVNERSFSYNFEALEFDYNVVSSIQDLDFSTGFILMCICHCLYFNLPVKYKTNIVTILLWNLGTCYCEMKFDAFLVNYSDTFLFHGFATIHCALVFIRMFIAVCEFRFETTYLKGLPFTCLPLILALTL